jgi:hypothetical protein
LGEFYGQGIEAVGDAVGFYVDQFVAVCAGIGGLEEGAMIFAEVG